MSEKKKGIESAPIGRELVPGFFSLCRCCCHPCFQLLLLTRNHREQHQIHVEWQGPSCANEPHSKYRIHFPRILIEPKYFVPCSSSKVFVVLCVLYAAKTFLQPQPTGGEPNSAALHLAVQRQKPLTDDWRAKATFR